MDNNILIQDKNKQKTDQPVGAQPEVTRPEVVQLKVVQLEVVQPKVVQPVFVQPAVADKKYTNIIFDLGAVLFYFNPHEILYDLFDLTKEQSKAIIKNISSSTWMDMDRGIITPEQVAEKLADPFGKENMLKFLYAMPERLIPLSQGVEILKLVRQKGYKTYILSNLAEFCYLKVKDYDFVKQFDGAIYSYQHKCAKPEEQIYRVLLETYSLKAEECLFIDDLEVNINGSKALGIDGIICKDHNYVLDQLKLLNVI